MPAELFTVPFQCVVVSGLAVPGATLTFYQTGTTTKLPVYTTSALTTQQTNPVVANGAGHIPDTYLDTANTYRLVIKNKAGTELDDIDPYIPGVTTLGITLTSATGQSVNSRGALAALSPVVNNQVAFLTEAGREGMFVFSTANLSAAVTADPQEGIYVAPAAASTGASGAWVRRYNSVVNARWFGADGTGDDAAALQAALDYAMANSVTCHIPGDSYSIGSSLTIDTNGYHVVGDGWENTRITPTAAVPAVIISGKFGKMENIGGWGTASGTGTGTGTYGLICQNAGSGEIISCLWRNFASDGVLIDTEYGPDPVGSNNLLRFIGGGADGNGGCGVRMEGRLDNNAISYIGFETGGNASHGILLKSEGGYVGPSCLSEANGGYGYQIAEDADPAASVNNIIDGPWIESNGSGGVRGAAMSAGNVIRFKNGAQSYSRHASAVNVIQRIGVSGVAMVGSGDDDSFFQVSGSGSSVFAGASSRSAANVNLYLTAAGTGAIVLLSKLYQPDASDLYAVDGVKVVGPQQGAVPSLGAGEATDTISTKVNTILGVLRTHGLIAT